MAVFEYQALSESGRKVKGIVDADTPVAARRKLREQRLFPTRVQESFGEAAGGVLQREVSIAGVSSRDLAIMTRQLAVLLQAGMPLLEAMTALLDQTPKAKLRKAVFDIREKISEGKSFADALSGHPRIFSPLYVNMVRAGEASGSLEQVLFRLTEILDHQARMKARVFSALAYPAFMIVFAVGIITFLTLVIVPRITALFEKQDQELPRLTEWLIATTSFIGSYWYLMVGAVLLAFIGWRYWISRPNGRLQWDRIRLRIPLYGPLLLKVISARFARILGVMLKSGLTMMKALEVVSTVIQNRYIEHALEDVRVGVRRGRDLAVPLKDANVFPPLLLHMTELGQRSGELEDMMIKVADTYDEDVQVSVEALVALLEPIIIVVMGLFVGLLVLSILLPILQMSTRVG